MKKRYKEHRIKWDEGIAVICPECGEKAQALPSWHSLNNKQKEPLAFLCPHCGLRKTYKELQLHKAYIKFNCPECGNQIEAKRPYSRRTDEKIRVECNYCHHTFTMKPRIEDKQWKFTYRNDGLKRDEDTGLPYYYQERVRGNLFWAYNRSHIALMQDYLSSDLRERVGMSTVARLPTFIKIKKNKELILKILDKWSQGDSRSNAF